MENGHVSAARDVVAETSFTIRNHGVQSCLRFPNDNNHQQDLNARHYRGIQPLEPAPMQM